MNCAELEPLICDYVDGTLDAEGRGAVESHLAECPACAALVEDSAEALSFIERAADVEPPPQLITRILFDAPWRKHSHASGIRGWLDRFFSPLLQPRLVMGMAMSVLSLSLMFHTVRQLKPSDLEPAKVVAGIEDRASRAWARTVKFYDDLKIVYQVESLLHEWQQQDEEQQKPAAQPVANPAPGQDSHRLPVKSVPVKSR
jgi:anti-sigma factor RsiW